MYGADGGFAEARTPLCGAIGEMIRCDLAPRLLVAAAAIHGRVTVPLTGILSMLRVATQWTTAPGICSPGRNSLRGACPVMGRE